MVASPLLRCHEAAPRLASPFSRRLRAYWRALTNASIAMAAANVLIGLGASSHRAWRIRNRRRMALSSAVGRFTSSSGGSLILLFVVVLRGLPSGLPPVIPDSEDDQGQNPDQLESV